MSFVGDKERNWHWNIGLPMLVLEEGGGRTFSPSKVSSIMNDTLSEKDYTLGLNESIFARNAVNDRWEGCVITHTSWIKKEYHP